MADSEIERQIVLELICPSSNEISQFLKEELTQLLDNIYKVYPRTINSLVYHSSRHYIGNQ